MNILKQLCTIFILCLFGELISSLLPFAFPASVISLILVFLLLFLKVIKPEQIADVSDYLLSTMAIFFVPAGVAIIEKFHLIKSSLLPLILITIVTTILTFAVTGYTVKFLIQRMTKMEEKKHGRNLK